MLVDKFTKMAHFIPHYLTDNAPKIAELFVDNVFKYYRLRKKIIIDRDTRFTSKFWRELIKLLDIKVNMSTAYHPQTNGQVERINRILEDYIRDIVTATVTTRISFYLWQNLIIITRLVQRLHLHLST